MSARNADGNALDCHYDKLGNVNAIVDNVDGRQTRSMGYDRLNRLTTVTSNMFGTASYNYGRLDNLRSLKVGAAGKLRDHQYQYNPSNRLTDVLVTGSGARAHALVYDVQGNLSTKDGQAYDFDIGNRLRAATGKEIYLYDGHGRRIESRDSSNRYSEWQYSQDGRLMYSHDVRNNRKTNYIYLGGSLLALRERPMSGVDVETIKYHHNDVLGTAVAETDVNKAVIRRSEYEPYGQLVNRPLTDGPGFTGHVQDAATGLTYMQQRYYDPELGRFLSVDPVTAYDNPVGAFNRYWYADNNPYSSIDRDGRQAEALNPPPPPPPTTLPTVTVTATAPSPSSSIIPTLPAVSAVAVRPETVSNGLAWISPAVGAMVSAPFLYFFSPHPCGGAPCGELTMESRKYSPGFWPGDKGAEQWGRENGVGASEGRRRFHGIKQSDKGQGGGKGRDDYGTNPDAGEVQNPQGETVGDLNHE